jgi:predicted enzyme involved in methoxymalonyl-ACP biosynthesis
LDLERYTDGSSREHINNQMTVLQQITPVPVLFVPIGGEPRGLPAGIHSYSLSHLELKNGERFWDPRGEAISGTRLSLNGASEVARDLGLKAIPALKCPRIKSLIVDLDNTLYEGVLGEDGVDGVVLSEYHRDLQKSLKNLSQSGVLLSLATKNDESDVENLFKSRSDFPLQLEDFFQVKA